MINKQDIFASSGQQTQGYSSSDYVGGMIPNTVAMAEDVNSFGNKLDTDVSSVCKEVANVITSGVLDKDGGDGQTLNSASFTQLLTALRAMSNGFLQTGIMFDGSTITCPVQNGTTGIKFGGQLKIMFNEGGYFGNSASKMHIGTIASGTTWTITNSVTAGAKFLVATLSGSTVVLSAENSVPTVMSNKCLLGSFFVVINNGTSQVQTDSWKFHPWLQNTPAIVRETPTAQTKGGLLTANSGATLKMGPLDVKYEGINFDYSNHQEPNVMKIPATDEFEYKFLYPGYNPSASAATTLDTTHIFNLTNNSWDDISSKSGMFMVMVPCIVPTGQTLMIPAMSDYNTLTGVYASLFDSVEDATNAVYNLKYTNPDAQTNPDRTRERAIYLGYSIVVKVGATDLTDPNNFAIVGMLPQALGGFTNAGGQTGGGTGAYIPMQTITWDTDAFTARDNFKNIATARTNQIVVTMPSSSGSQVHQLEIQYTHSTGKGGIRLQTAVSGEVVKWWGDNEPDFEEGKTYLIICEYANGWKAGYLAA